MAGTESWTVAARPAVKPGQRRIPDHIAAGRGDGARGDGEQQPVRRGAEIVEEEQADGEHQGHG